MASGIAHDFNNALTPILGFSEMLSAHPERLENTDSAMSQIQIINTAARTAAASVARLREFYRSRLQDDVFLPFDLNGLVDEAISMTQARWKDEAQAKGVTVTVATSLQEVPSICGNASEIRGALINLILNAVDAMTDGGELTIATRVDASHVACVVTDQGIGMTEEVRRRCIDPFFTTKGPQLGTGMGLPMVYGAIQRHDGKIEIESEVGSGTSISMLLPLSAPPSAQTNGGNSAERPAKPLHLLVVDDEPMVVNLVAEFLKSEDHTVVVAANGREGLEKYCAGAFDLVVTDRAMPEMSGDQLASAIKERDPQTPIIMLTGFGANMLSGREIPADVDLIMSKPFDLSELRQALADLTSTTVSMNVGSQIAART